ncbi:hypothetical protein [Streptomyces sp. NPDC020667]|uniref:hypothetical protein n=1 Tax=Streptomyces sp. NPDC020667 TaxID=3154895 RepID=UPI0033D84B0F
MTKAISSPDEPCDLEAEAFAAVAKTAEHGEVLGADRLAELLLQAGRLNGPALLFDAWFGQVIDVGTLVAQVGRVWSMAEYPDAALDREVWRRLFATAGFTVDGRPAERPARLIELWRGSVPERRADWSWSACRAVAEGYATGSGARRPATGRLTASSLRPARCSPISPAATRTSTCSTPTHWPSPRYRSALDVPPRQVASSCSQNGDVPIALSQLRPPAGLAELPIPFRRGAGEPCLGPCASAGPGPGAATGCR